MFYGKNEGLPHPPDKTVVHLMDFNGTAGPHVRDVCYGLFFCE